MIAVLQENLQKEGKLSQQFSCLVTGILSPVQAALLALDAWPAFCDCLALAAALAAGQRGEGRSVRQLEHACRARDSSSDSTHAEGKGRLVYCGNTIAEGLVLEPVESLLEYSAIT